MKKNYALITGATSGIGFEFARILAEYGYNLVLVSRDEEKLKYIKKEFQKLFDLNIEYFPCDLTYEQDVYDLYRAVSSNNIQIDYLVNNAGFGLFDEFLNSDVNSQLDMIKVNIQALTMLTHLFAKGMKERRYGTILNVSSIASYAAGPNMTVYYASKAYVTSFTEGLHEELSKYNIKVTCVIPGPVKTNFWKRAGLKKASIIKYFFEDAGEVAYKGIKANIFNRTLKHTSIFGLITAILASFLPRYLTRKITKFANTKG